MPERQTKAVIPPQERVTTTLDVDVLTNNLEAQWLIKALKKMEEQVKAGIDVAEELNRQIELYKKTGNSESLISQAMGIVANIGLPHVRNGSIEVRDILEAAPDAILHAALVHVDMNVDFITCLTITMEEFCAEFSNNGDIIGDDLLSAPNKSRRNPKSPMDTLALRAKAGDSYAINKVLEECKTLVWSLIRKKRYNLPDGDVYDLYQEAMMSITRAIKIYDVTKSSFYNLAKLAATRALIAAIKTSNREKHRHLNSADSLSRPTYDEGASTLGEVIPNPLLDVDRYVIAKERLSEMDDLLMTKLTDMEYVCITLTAEGYSYEEISEKTNYGEKTIDNALQRVKGKLKKSGIFLN